MVNNPGQERQFEFNSTYVIDSLASDELQTALELFNDIILRRLTRIDSDSARSNVRCVARHLPGGYRYHRADRHLMSMLVKVIYAISAFISAL